ncbi:MAG: hypothetical protein NT139_00290 [Candidatus Woesearchaeota archaeon]|nr:hypothetical protein [Candidatus Woesearchaeota archaeon]
MLNPTITKKIEDFVYAKPRSIQEIASYINKSWRTADRYIQEIEKEYGTITTRVFREGTRGALKIVYWASIEKIKGSIFQEKLAKEIETFKKKEDFSAFDIYQHVSDKNKIASLDQTEQETKTNLDELKYYLEKTQKQLLVLSGNLSWTNLKNNKVNVFSIIENLVKKNISIKIICRVDLASMENIEQILSLNFKYGKELIEIRHSTQPLRALVIDNKLIRLKEIKEPTDKIHELSKRLFIFYTIKDKEWVEWLTRIFWKMFSNSIDARKRIEELKKLKSKK